MKKLILLGLVVVGLAACTGSYVQGNCEYDYLLHPKISISRLIGC